MAAFSLSGCRQYLDRSDTITAGVADATDTNKAVQTITRWPAESRYDRWNSDGERARVAIERYKTRTVTEPKQLDKDPVDAEPTPTEPATKAN
ncbi:MAG: hypothetical protein C0519_02220 [Hyphomicrobium sp.]|nr:hypothetical protein [Hyphomicrobium sp.]PPD09406.1 MAG: hypothetical protein CTY28_00880 [Hyphomicrobium sp.]